MDARQARNLSRRGAFLKDQSDYALIKDAIKKAAEDGHREVEVEMKVSKVNKERLRAEKFIVTSRNPCYEEYYTVIRW